MTTLRQNKKPPGFEEIFFFFPPPKTMANAVISNITKVAWLTADRGFLWWIMTRIYRSTQRRLSSSGLRKQYDACAEQSCHG